MNGISIECNKCGAKIEVTTYRKFVVCPYCGDKTPFTGFNFPQIDRSSSKYGSVKYEMDCPSCRGKNMFLFSSKWRCEDCGYEISKLKKNFMTFWFCDECDTFLNVQSGFTTKNKKWVCTECGHINGTTKNDLL